MVEHYRGMSNQGQKFSLEVINKSMLAVEMIRTYKKEAQIAERNGERKEGSKTPTAEQVENLENMITACQTDMQTEIVAGSLDPQELVKNPLSLQRLKVGSTLALIAATQDKSQQKVASDRALANMLFFNHWHNYENQSSNILEMVRRYETPLK